MERTITLISKTVAHKKPTTVSTRSIRKEDAQALARLLFSSYDDSRVPSQAHALKEIESILDGSHGDFYPEASPVVVDQHDRVVPAVLCLRNRKDQVEPANVATIYELFTAASRRREGLAEQLIRMSINTMYRDGLSEVTVQIPESNAAALALYLTLEFRRWQSPDDAEELL